VSSREPLRIGDAERSQAAELLSEHMAEGRLTQLEFDERLNVALTWTVAALLYFQADFRHWTIFILPMVLSIALGKLKGARH
jgi:hypothetical protein